VGNRILIGLFLMLAMHSREGVCQQEPSVLKPLFTRPVLYPVIAAAGQNPFLADTGSRKVKKDIPAIPSGFSLINQPFTPQKLPLFCRWEYQIEKSTTLPLRFRLGSIDYTDYLEQKPNARRQ